MQEPKKGPAHDDQGTHVPNRFANRDDETEMIERDPVESSRGGSGHATTLYPDEKDMAIPDGVEEERDRQKQKEREAGSGDAPPPGAAPVGETGGEDAEEDRVRPGDRKRGREGHP
jgi:hypothetical protein